MTGAPLRASVAVGVLAAIVAAPSAARADPEAEARALFAKGREVRLQGDCAAAVPIFRKTYAIYPQGLGSLRNIAECEEAEGHFAAARRAWIDLGHALITRSDARYDGWTDDARTAVERLGAKVATLTVDVVAVGPTGERYAKTDAHVDVNGEPLAVAALGAGVDRDPGRYVVRLEGTSEPQVVELAPGDSKHVVLDWRPTAPGALGSGAPAPVGALRSDGGEAEGSKSADHVLKTAMWTSFGIGAAGFTGAAASFVVRQSALDEVKAACPRYQSAACDPSLRSAADRGSVASTLTDVFLVVGGVGAVTGLTLFAIHHGHDAPATVVASPGGIAVLGTF